MIRSLSLWLIGASLFLSLLLATAATGEELPGLDVHVLGQHAYVAGLSFGLGAFEVIDRSRLNTPGRFLFNPDR